MELRQLKAFLAIAEELHFGRAAKRLHLAQPALSQQLRQLEEHLGVALFNRNSKRVELTDKGRQLLPFTRTALQALASGKEVMQREDSGEEGIVRVGFISTAAISLIPTLIKLLNQRYSKISLVLHETAPVDQIDMLLNGHLDLAFTDDNPQHPALKAQIVEESEILLALPVGHSLTSRSKVSLKSLAGETLLVSASGAQGNFQDVVMQLCRQSGVEPAKKQEVRMLQTALLLVASGAGCALLPSLFQKLKPKGVVFRPISGITVRMPMFIVSSAYEKTRVVTNVLRLITEFSGK